MAQTLAFIHEIESLVSDKLQVVSYKWLSRNYMVSSDEAKRLLQEFVEKHDGRLEVVYALSGWLKSSHPSYHIRLVTGPKLAEYEKMINQINFAIMVNDFTAEPLPYQAFKAKLKTNRTDGFPFFKRIGGCILDMDQIGVSMTNQSEAQQEFDGNCSVQVYSVQASIPKDPAVLWNAEFIQAEELFKQPSSVDNCLRDNRFCGISSSFVRRNVDGPPVVSAAPQTKSAVGMEPTKSNIVHQPSKNIARDSIPKIDLKSQDVVKDVKSESNGTGNTGVHDHINKPTEDKEKVLPLPTGKKKVQADKGGSVTGGSLASFWGRASAKPKPCSLPAENNNTFSNPTVATEGAQTCAREAGEGDSGDDDNQDVTLRRSSNRKRRVVFDFSDEDEDEDAVNLASPDFPNKQSSQDSRQNDKKSSEKASLNFGMQIENKSRVKEETAIDEKANQPRREDFSVISKCTSTGKSSTEKLQCCAPEISVNKDSQNNATPGSPKRRKVMKTRIDERGREVTEVVWEGEETEAKKADKVTTKKSDNNAPINAVNSAPASKKSANTISNPTGKGGTKKAGNSKDPKQGNILSFFKRV